MAHITTIPSEIFLIIAEQLDGSDLLSLRQTSKSINMRAQETHYQRVFSTRRYFITLPDLEALLKFSTHPSKANLYLKHLQLDLSSPYIRYDKKLDRTKQPKYHKRYPYSKNIARVCQTKVNQYLGFCRDMEDFPLLFATFQNLPNLESITFSRLPDNRSSSEKISEKIYQLHYPELCSPERHWLNFFNSSIRFHRVISKQLQPTFTHVMFSLARSPVTLKAISFDKTSIQWQSLDLDWFNKKTRNHEKDASAFMNLRRLDLNVCESGFEEEEGISSTDYIYSQRCFVEFLMRLNPHLEELAINSDFIGDISQTEDHWNGRYWPYKPLLLLDLPFKLRNLKKLTLSVLAFVEREIKALLISHSSTLREVRFESCLLQAEHQVWSPVFRLLQSDLSLEVFEYELMIRRFDYAEFFPSVKVIPYFRIRGDVRRDGAHHCEFYAQRNTTRLDFEKAMKLVLKLENEIILNDEIHAEDPADTLGYASWPSEPEEDNFEFPQSITPEIISQFLEELDLD